MSTRSQLMRLTLTLLILLGSSSSTFAADSPKPECPAGPTKEMREKMASWHDQMATCLRSDKAITECRSEMAQSHAQMMHAMGCPERKMHSHASKNPQTPPQK